MTSIVVSGDDILSIKELTLNVRKIIKNIIDKESVISYTVSVEDISTNGGNFLGRLQTATIYGQTKDGDKEVNLFLKNIIHMAEDSALIDAPAVYLREGLFYKEISKLYEAIEDKYNIPREERLNIIPCYSETNGEVIILEDVSKKGYKTYDRFDVVPLKFAELSIEQLAKLHAMSFVVQTKYPNYFDTNIINLKSLHPLGPDIEMYLRKSCDKAMEALDDDAKSKLDTFFLKSKDKLKTYLEAENAVCLLHGDFKANNILVKEINGEPVKVIPADYQLVYYGYPTIDFNFFIFTSTDQQFRRDHLEHLKELYFNTFENCLSRFGIEAKDVYSRKQFETEFREKLDFGLIAFLILMPLLFAKTDDIPTIENGLDGVHFNLDDRYKVRLQGIVDDYIRWGYL